MTSSDALDNIRDLLELQRVAALATCGEEGPYASLVAVGLRPDAGALYFASPRASNKSRHLLADPRAALLFDDRNRHDTLHAASALTVFGSARPLEGMVRDTAAALMIARFPELKRFLSDPETVLFRLTPERYRLVDRFQRVFETDALGGTDPERSAS